jgi:hypothetical protein
MPRQSTRAATAIRHLRESQDALLCKQVMQIRAAAAAGHLTAAETADAIELAHLLRDHTLRIAAELARVRRLFPLYCIRPVTSGTGYTARKYTGDGNVVIHGLTLAELAAKLAPR